MLHKRKKEQEELKAKELVDKNQSDWQEKNLQDNKNIRLEKYDTHFIDMINKNATEIFDNQFEHFKKGSYLKKMILKTWLRM